MAGDKGQEEFLVARQPLWTGGVGQFFPSDLAGDAQAVSLENADVIDHSTIRRRGGLTLWKTYQTGIPNVGSRPRALSTFRFRDHPPCLVACIDTSDTESSVLIDDGSTSGVLSLASPHKLSEHVDIVQMLDRLYVLEPGHSPLSWTWGEVALRVENSLDQGMPSCESAIFMRGRAWCVNKDTLYFSDSIFSPSNSESTARQFRWHPSTDAIRLLTGYGVKLLAYRNQALLIFTDRGLERIIPPEGTAFLPFRDVLSDNVGCSSKWTVKMMGEDVIWQDQTGHLRSLARNESDELRGVLNQPVSLVIQNAVERQTKHRLFTAKAEVFRGLYWWFFPIESRRHANEGWALSVRGDTAFIGPHYIGRDFDSASAAVRRGGECAGLVKARFENEEERLYLLSKTTNAGVVLRFLEGRTDNGVNIPVELVTKAHTFQQSELRKQAIHLRVEGRLLGGPTGSLATSVTLNVQIRPDEGIWITPSLATLPGIFPNAGVTLPTTFPVTFTSYPRQFAQVPLDLTAHSRTLQARIRASTAFADFEILNVSLIAHETNLEFDV